MRYLFTADIHLRTTRPVCRTDDWDEFQTNRFRAIYDTARLHKCNAVVIVGDLFDNPNPSEKLLHLVLTTITSYGIMTVVMVGNHDVPYHALQHLADTKIALLGYHPLVKFLTPEPGHGIDFVSSYDGVRLIHELTFERDEDIPATVKAHTADDWLKEFPDDDLIVCGDMHRPFSKTVDERTVINCGHIACQKVSERYKSGVWVVDDYEGKIEYIEFPSDLEFVSTDQVKVWYKGNSTCLTTPPFG